MNKGEWAATQQVYSCTYSSCCTDEKRRSKRTAATEAQDTLLRVQLNGIPQYYLVLRAGTAATVHVRQDRAQLTLWLMITSVNHFV